ncbi:MAG TPA: universal stress protein [Bryobacteraceae bacterium]|nr:universal stress protein [Bryobacteraceae bacterium]
MPEIRRILFPVDFSRQCVLAAPFIRDLAARLGAELTVLHVADPVSFRFSSFELNVRPLQEILDDLTAQRRKCFFSHVLRLFPESPPRHVMLRGDPLEQIVAYTSAGKFDLVAIPEHPHGSLRTLVSESLAAKVMERVSAAVWSTEHAVGPAVPVDPHIVCALAFHRGRSFESANLEILAAAQSLAGALGGRLSIVHVMAAGEMEQAAGLPCLRVDPDIDGQLRRIRQTAGEAAEYHLESGDIIASLVDFVSRHQADLLVIGRSYWRAAAEDHRPHAAEIVHRAPCPVLSVYAPPVRQAAAA